MIRHARSEFADVTPQHGIGLQFALVQEVFHPGPLM